MTTTKQYFAEIGVDKPLTVDIVLALLRINTPESLARASKLAGIEITKCPPAVPPWPPKPVAARAVVKVVRVGRNPCLPTTGAFQKFRMVRVGMTREQLKKRGLDNRDIRQWTNQGHIEWSTR